MAQRSNRIMLYDPEKLKKVNDESITLLNKYKVDMSIRDLCSPSRQWQGYPLLLLFAGTR